MLPVNRNSTMIFAILQNVRTGRYHPILFFHAPMPPGFGPEHRYRSLGHHIPGFDTAEEARQCCAEHTNSGRLIPWDGEEIPAMDEFFNEKPG
jgi:hypothetical protein